MGTLLKVSIWISANYMAPILGAKVDNIVSMDVDLTFGVIEDPYLHLWSNAHTPLILYLLLSPSSSLFVTTPVSFKMHENS
jgi:hypothetical protein